MNCKSCRHCQQQPWPGLWLICVLTGALAVRRCAHFEREPGADDA